MFEKKTYGYKFDERYWIVSNSIDFTSLYTEIKREIKTFSKFISVEKEN
jgi:hypothetical protein